MKVAITRAPGSLQIEEREKPICPDGGAILKVEACSICLSDVKIARAGHRDLTYPRILGHEIAGVIDETSSKDPTYSMGNRIQLWPGLACGHCSYCDRGLDNLCETIGIMGFNVDGGFAEYIAIPQERLNDSNLNGIAEGISFEQATMAEPLGCCLHGQDILLTGEGDTVLILGAGAFGSLNALLARHRNAKTVIVAEKLKTRLESIKSASPDFIIDTTSEDLNEMVYEYTSGRGVDAILLSTSEVGVDDRLMKLLAPKGGICAFSGLPANSSSVLLDSNRIHYRELTVAGAYGCTSSDNSNALKLIASGEIDVSWLITHRISLDDIWEGIEYSEKRKGLKTTVTKF